MLRLSAPVVAADTLDYLTAQFVFRSADWIGMEKWAHFAKGGTVYDISLTDDKIRREDHLNLGAGEWKVYVHGNRFADGKVVERITTAEDVLRVVPTGALNGEPFPEIPASVTEQILARLENVEQNGGGGGGTGAVFTPSVSEDGVISWTNDGGLPDPDPVNIRGPQGDSGVHVGSDVPPAGTRVWVNPSGQKSKFPQIDDTLTQPGYAADAKAVGEKIDQLSEEIADISPYDDVNLTSQQGQVCREFAALFDNITGDVDSFLFFTDPHTIHPSGMLPRFHDSLDQIAAVYHNAPVSACICGGDWLNNSNQRDNACWVLGCIDGAMKRRFDKYVLIVGNHDTNYQGYEYMESGKDGTYDREESAKCALSYETIRGLWHRDKAASYFATRFDSGTYYVFNTGIDWITDMDEYRWEQVDWFAEKLLEDDPTNCAGLLHIPQSNTPFINYITQIAEAFNAKRQIAVNGKTYDFSGTSGKFRFIVGGHTHKDAVNIVNSIPVVTTKNLQAVDEYSFDLMIADYAANTLHIVRVGDGENRIVEMAGSADAPAVNLFEYGTRLDYNYQNQVPVTDTTNASFTVNAAEGYIRKSDTGGGSSVFFKNDLIENDGSTFVLSADFVNETEGNTARNRFYLRAFTGADTVYSGAIENATFLSLYNAHYIDANPYTFKLPSDVTAFQIGFLFDSVENNSDYIRIINVSLTKE